MAWLAANWFSVLIFIAFISMHMFGHGGHGAYAGLVFVPIYNFFTRRWGVAPALQ